MSSGITKSDSNLAFTAFELYNLVQNTFLLLASVSPVAKGNHSQCIGGKTIGDNA